MAWALSDAGPGKGGFCCIPGSHKSNYRLPQQISENFEESPYVINPDMPAGSVILFSESLTHGTATWNAMHERRTLLYKYCVIAHRLDVKAGGIADVGRNDAAPTNPPP